MKLPSKIPTILGLILVITIVGGIIMLERIFRSPSNASGSQSPENIHITNISDTSFTFSWTTQLPVSGTILVSTTGKSNYMYYDQRDSTGKLGSYVTHGVTVRDAKPSSEYTVTILSGGKQYLDNGKAFIVHTPVSIAPNSNGLEPAYGTILSTNDDSLEGVLVYLTVDGGQELSAMTKASGLWLIPLNQMRTGDLTGYLPTIERMTENILVQTNGMESSAITDTLNDSPVPEMTIGKTYDFRHQQANAPQAKTLALQTDTSLPAAGTVLGQTTSRSFTVSLTHPEEGAAVVTTLPFVQGTGVPNAFVGISLGITQIISGSTKVDANGLWSFTPPKPLGTGKQSVTITTVDEKGKTVAITHTFQIMKSGTQVLGDATPSATLTPENTPIITASPTPETIPTSTLSGEPPPTSGNEFPTILLILLGIGLCIGGTFAIL
jgi:hypothetical protein